MKRAEIKGCVSVIIPAFNSERYLAEAVKSVLDQTYKQTECIVVDDGSTDNTAAIAKGFGDRIRYFYQENAERSVARNTGIKAATGQYLLFLDADDFFASGKIADQIAYLEEHPEHAAVYSRVRFFHGDGEKKFFDINRPTPAGDILRELLYGNFITVHSPLIRRSAVDAAGGFSSSLTHNEDWEFFLRLALSGFTFGFLDQYHAFCRMHQTNTSRDQLRMYESKWQVIREFVLTHDRQLRSKGIDTERVLAYHQADYGKALIGHGSLGEGRRHIFQACKVPFPRRGKYLFFAVAAPLLGQKLSQRLGRGRQREPHE